MVHRVRLYPVVPPGHWPHPHPKAVPTEREAHCPRTPPLLRILNPIVHMSLDPYPTLSGSTRGNVCPTISTTHLRMVHEASLYIAERFLRRHGGHLNVSLCGRAVALGVQNENSIRDLHNDAALTIIGSLGEFMIFCNAEKTIITESSAASSFLGVKPFKKNSPYLEIAIV